MTDLTIKELINRMPTAFIPEKAVGVDAVIQYHQTGAEAGDYIITVKDGSYPYYDESLEKDHACACPTRRVCPEPASVRCCSSPCS